MSKKAAPRVSRKKLPQSVHQNKLLMGSGIFVGLCLAIAIVTSFLESRHILNVFANGTMYYVSCVNGNDSNTGQSITTPWKSLAPVQNTPFQPGDTIAFERGCTWDVNADPGLMITRSGTQDSPITFTDYGSGAQPVLSNSYGASYARVLHVQANWIVIQNLTISNAKEDGIVVMKNYGNVTIQNNNITNVGVGVYVFGNSVTIANNTIHDLHMVVNTPTADDDYGAEGVILVGSNNQVTHNAFFNCIAQSYDYGVDGGAVEFFSDGSVNNVSGNTVSYNLMKDNAGVVEFGSVNNTLFANNTLAYNRMINNGMVAVLHLNDSFQGQYSNNLMAHNTMYENPSQYVMAANRGTPWRLFVFTQGQPTTSMFSLENNILQTYGFAQLSTSGNFTHLNNDYFINGGVVGYTLGTGEITADPLFVSEANKDFHLQANSPAIDAGKVLGMSPDFEGNPVPQGNAPDMGAFEFVQVSSTSPSPTATPQPSSSPSPTPSASPISDVTGPNVTITSPVEGSTLPTKNSFLITANASDPSGVKSIQLQLDGKVVKTCTSTTSCSTGVKVTTVSVGQHIIKAVAVDNSPLANSSWAQVTVTKK